MQTRPHPSPRNPWQVLLALLTVLSAIPALAVDGVIEINDARAFFGGLTAGDAPNYPVTISEPGSYRLTSNLQTPDADTHAIHVTSPHVTLDLNGFTVRGAITCTGAGAAVSCSPSGSAAGILVDTDFVTVRNGVVTGFANGLVENGMVSDVVVEEIRAVGNAGLGLLFSVSENVSVTHCLTARNGGRGMFLKNGARVIDNLSFENRSDGIFVRDGSLVRGNVIRGNGANGLNVQGSSASNMTGNSITSNVSSGIVFTTPGAYGNNALHGNGVTVSGGVETSTNFCNTNTTCP